MQWLTQLGTTMIQNCWQKAGILPKMDASHTANPSIPVSSLLYNDVPFQMDPVVHAKRQVEVALDELIATGALQKTNQMEIESLLNPEGESQILTEISNEEIYQAVMDALEAHENMEITGWDDVDNNVPPEPCPTCCNVVKAVSTINKYIIKLNDLQSCKLEAMLNAFNWQLCFDKTKNLKEMILTDFFTPA